MSSTAQYAFLFGYFSGSSHVPGACLLIEACQKGTNYEGTNQRIYTMSPKEYHKHVSSLISVVLSKLDIFLACLSNQHQPNLGTKTDK